MKVLSTYLTTLLLSSLPSLSLACRCLPQTLGDALYNIPDSIVIAGRIIDELKLNNGDDEFSNRYFAFRVKQVYKAPCSIQPEDVIIVSTTASSAACGLDLQPNTRYTFNAAAVVDYAVIPSLVQVSVNSCAYNVQGELSAADKQTLRNYKKGPCTQPPKPCQTGVDCDQDNEYCDTTTNLCVVINETPCPCLPTPCFAPPCSVTEPCDEAANALKPVTCVEDYCCGCTAIFLDANRSRVCYAS